MAEGVLASPFDDGDVAERPLEHAPLVRVVAQVRFPALTSMAGGEAFETFAKALQSEYPMKREFHEVQVSIGPQGVKQLPTPSIVNRLVSANEEWQVSLGDTFLALDTPAYTSRHDFCSRLIAVLHVFGQVANPPMFERVGIRYVNQITDDDILRRLVELVRPEALGGSAVPRPEGVELHHSMCETRYTLADASLHVRWGHLPAGAVLDPAIAGVPGLSWVLDLDSFRDGRTEVDLDEIEHLILRLADQAYRYFLWVVSEDFLKSFGGQ